MDDDIYCIGFIMFYSEDSHAEKDRLVLKCFFTFLVQMAFFATLLYQYMVNDNGFFESIQIGNASLNVARILCAFLLHVQVMPEVIQAKNMMSFALKNPDRFRGKRGYFYPVLFSLFKMIGGLSASIANMLVTLHQQDIENAIKDFIAVEVIKDIDNIIASTLVNISDIEEFIERHPVEIDWHVNQSQGDFAMYKTYWANCCNCRKKKQQVQNDHDEDDKYFRDKEEAQTSGDESDYESENDGLLDCFDTCFLTVVLFFYRLFSIVFDVVIFYFGPLFVTLLVVI